jgi:hypothetical protein
MARPRRNLGERETLIAVESGWWTAPDGTEYAFRAGETLVASDHPLVMLGNSEWFKPVDPLRRRPSVEEATDRPGEMREQSAY